MSYEEFPFYGNDDQDSWEEDDELEKNRYSMIITDLVVDMSELIKECKEDKEGIYSTEDLDLINNRMSILLDQGMFWLARNNQGRYIYDLNDFISWLCEFMENKEIENND